MDYQKPLKKLWPAFVLALVSIISGGLLSAVTAHAATQTASWVSAYLVLVGGVATFGLTVGRGLLSRAEPSSARLLTELTFWVSGNLLVVLGTLASPRWFVELGSLLLVAALGFVAHGVHRGSGPRWLRWLFITLVSVLIVSIPVGILLSHLRS